MSKLKKASEILNKEVGIEGSSERENFKDKAYSYYFSEILRSRRKQLKLSQEDLAKRKI